MERTTEYEENLRLPRLTRAPREYPPLREVSHDLMHAAGDAIAAVRRAAEPVGQAGSKREPLDSTATFVRIDAARRLLSNLERDLVRALYKQATRS